MGDGSTWWMPLCMLGHGILGWYVQVAESSGLTESDQISTYCPRGHVDKCSVSCSHGGSHVFQVSKQNTVIVRLPRACLRWLLGLGNGRLMTTSALAGRESPEGGKHPDSVDQSQHCHGADLQRSG